MSRRSRLGSLAVLMVAAVASAPAAAVAEQEPFEWVALGDSYTAGVFVGVPEGGPDRDGCDRTTNSYPDLVAHRFVADPVRMMVRLTNVSCGNATIADVYSAHQEPISPVWPPNEGWSSVASQIDRAGIGANTDVITVGVGGNSLSLGTIMSTCLLLGTGQDDDATPCRDAYERGNGPFVAEPIHDTFQRVFQEYVTMLDVLRGRAPNATIVTVGYPVVFPTDGSGCERPNTRHFAAIVNDMRVSMTKGDISWLHDVLAELNLIIEDSTDLVDRDYVYVDTASASQGRDVCKPDGVRWVEGMCGTAPDYWPTSLAIGTAPFAFTLSCADGARATIVHPNQGSHANTATLVERAIRTAIGTRR